MTGSTAGRHAASTVRSRVLAAGGLALLACLTAGTPAEAKGIPSSGIVDVATSADATLTGSLPGEQAGWETAAVGDVNGDGRADIAVGAPLADVGERARAGEVYVVFGPVKADGQLDQAPGLRIFGATARSGLGSAVAPAGDVNGDGLADVLVGAPRAEELDGDAPGDAYVVFGRRERAQIDLAAAGESAVLRLRGAQGGDATGGALAPLGDLNADGLADVAVGAPRTNGPDRQAQPDIGAVSVVYGSRSGGTVELGALPPERGYRITGVPRSLTGFALDLLTDVNGDGRAEVLVGAPGRTRDAKAAGHAFVVFGRADGASVALGGLTPADGMRFAGPAGALFGTSVAAPGDVDADGRPDVAVGAPLADPEDRKDAGSVFVLSTPPAGQNGPDSGQPLTPAQGLRIDGANAGDLAGEAVDPAGDIDADGNPDVAVSAPAAAILGRARAGVTSIVYAGRAAKAGAGKTDRVRVDLSGLGVNGFRVASSAATSSYVRTARAVGDLDGDGAADLIVGELEGRPTGMAGVAAPTRTPGADKAAPGSVHVVLAPTPKPKPPPLPTDPGEAEEVAAGCRAAKAVELIIDDSGSMSGTDPGGLRSDAVRLLLAKPRNVGRTFGAVEFGELGGELFPPQVVADPAQDRVQRDELYAVLAKTVAADNGGTDYNAGFAAASSALPDADARIFLTDGEHNVGRYDNGHRGGPPTYVVGLTVGRKGVAGQRLARIAKESKATYFPSLSQKNLQPIINRIDSRLNCDVDLDLFVDKLEAEDVGEPNEVELDDDTESLELAVSWDDAQDRVTPGIVDLLSAGGRRLATVSARAQRKALQARGGTIRLADGMTLRGARAPTFYTLRLTGVKRYGSVRVRTATRKVKGAPARINTQVGQSRRRR